MKKSGLADSPFFSPPTKQPPTAPLLNHPVHFSEGQNEKPKGNEQHSPIQTNYDDTVIPRHHDTTKSQSQAAVPPPYPETLIQHVRKTVKELGKEAATHRFTAKEKEAIADMIYTYKRLGIKTTENEITRIAVNFVIRDYKENGRNSILTKVLEALLA